MRKESSGPAWLNETWNDEFVPPVPEWGKVDGDRPLFFPGEVHIVYGKGGHGKTWLALHTAAEMAMSGKRSLIIDYENTMEYTTYRLRRMGVSEEASANIGYIKMLHPVQNRTKEIADWVETNGVSLVVIDSVARALASGDADENDNGKVAAFMQSMEPLRATKTAIVLIDHVKHHNDDARSAGYVPSPRGASSKVDQVAVAYFCQASDPWSDAKSGYAELYVKKCRFGVRREGDRAAVMNAHVSPERVTISLVAPAAQKFPGVRNQAGMQALLDYVASGKSEGLSKTVKYLCDTLNIKADAARTLIDAAVQKGWLVKEVQANGLPTLLALPKSPE